ncbi:MAG: hypothetical protein CYPHOPRED_001976 [Cyphobasidiales sp. Tagirdzhanova-0007]|nr:MAG: hypothetical protein CYPHOPRED_001976 [Cyphobasidiales sp. Tagirdzhanova-0007]
MPDKGKHKTLFLLMFSVTCLLPLCARATASLAACLDCSAPGRLQKDELRYNVNLLANRNHEALKRDLPSFTSSTNRVIDGKTLERRQTFGTDTTYTTTTTITTIQVNGNGVSEATVTQTVTEIVDPDIVSTSTSTVSAGIATATTTIFASVAPAVTAFTTTTQTTTTLYRTTRTSTQATRTPADASTPTGVALSTTCEPGDSHQKESGTLSVTRQQRDVLYVLGFYILGILIAWNLIGLRTLLYPVKMLVVAYHEFWHILVGVCLGAKLFTVSIDPGDGGRTIFNADEPIAAMFGNALLGAVLVFCGFNTLASKIASFFIGLSFAAILWYASEVIILLLTAAWIGLMIGLWFIDHALYLKYYILFIGVMTAWYFAWDIMNDLVFRKVNPCCPKQLSYRLSTPEGNTFFPAAWVALAWMAVSVVLFVGFIILAVYVFRYTLHGEYCQAKTFLPT